MTTHLPLAKHIVLALCPLLLTPPVSAQTEPVTLNFATAYSRENFHTVNLQSFADDVNKVTGGKVSVTLHPDGSLIKPADIFAGVRAGKAEAGEVIMSSLLNEDPLFGMDALPFIVSGYADARNMWNASRAGIEKALSERGLQLLYAVPWPPQNLYSTRPISNMQHFKGLRMRSYNPATQRIAELVGARPVTIQSVDLTKAIADGGLDLMITSSPTGVDTKAWTKMTHYYKVHAWIPKNVVFINQKIFARLNAHTQKKIFDAAQAAEKRGWKLSQDNDVQFESQLAANKITIAPLDPYLRTYLDRIGETLAREWLKQAGGDDLQILLKYTTERSMK